MGGTFDSPASGGAFSSSSSSSPSGGGSGATRSGRFGDGLRGGRTPSPSSPPSSSGSGATRPGRWGDGLRGGWGGGWSPSGTAGAASSTASSRSARPWTGGLPDIGAGGGGLSPGSGATGGGGAGALSPSAGPSAGRARVTGPGSGAGRPASAPDRRPASGQTASGQTGSAQSASRAPADPQAETNRQIAAVRERQAAQEKADRQARDARDARDAARNAERAAEREAWPGGLAAGKAAAPKRQTPRPAGPRPGDAAPLSLSESAAKAPSRGAQYVTQMPAQRSASLSNEAEGDIARLAAAVNRTKDLSGLEPIVKDALEAEPWRALPEMSRLREQVRDADNLAWIDRMIDRYGPRATGSEPPAAPVFQGREDGSADDLIAGPSDADALVGGSGDDAYPVPVSGATEEPPAGPDETAPDPGLLERLRAFDRELDAVGRGVLGPAWEQTKALARLATELSPWSDGEAVVEAVDQMVDGLMQGDRDLLARGVDSLSWAIVGAAAPGRVRATRDMPYDQRAKLDGPPPDVPKSPEENIARGTKAMARVLATGEADMAAMHRKDLGWIAFEPGVVSLTPSGDVKGAGFKKIQAKHAEDIAMIPQVIERGQISIEEPRVGRRSYILNHKRYRVAIRKQFFETHQTWVVTAYEKVE